jgi:ergothioneine biosynthesis protein EgtB
LKSRSIKFKPVGCQEVNSDPNTKQQRRQQLKQSLNSCRLGTLALFDQVDEAVFCHLAHPEFSPVGWHLGHIAYTESLWLLERSAGLPPMFPEYRRLFVADGLPKSERVNLPTFEVICQYLNAVREQVLSVLETANLAQQERLWRWIIQHESQHSETIAFVLQLQRWQREAEGAGGVRYTHHSPLAPRPLPLAPQLDEMVKIPAGYFEQGNDSIDALDNEQPVHQVYLDTYWIDRYPVTCGQYRLFIEAGGYQNPHCWLADGWKWLQSQQIKQPLYWSDNTKWDNHPVCGVSWYEAEAYTRFVGKRLPTEAEWEKAASWDIDRCDRRIYPWGEATPDTQKCNHNNAIGQTTPVNAYPNGQSAYGCYDMLGNVWEWTASVFDGYEGFATYPYVGYSKVYFDGQHQVLKGGSWATPPWALRSSFRNWYHPGIRQILAGFRCAN